MNRYLISALLITGLTSPLYPALADERAAIRSEQSAAGWTQPRQLTIIRARSADAAADAVIRVGGEVQFLKKRVSAVRAELTRSQIEALQRDVRVIRVTVDRATHVAA